MSDNFIQRIKEHVEEFDFDNEFTKNEKLIEYVNEIKRSFNQTDKTELLFGLKFGFNHPNNFLFFKLMISSLIYLNYKVIIREINSKNQIYSIIVKQKTT